MTPQRLEELYRAHWRNALELDKYWRMVFSESDPIDFTLMARWCNADNRYYAKIFEKRLKKGRGENV